MSSEPTRPEDEADPASTPADSTRTAWLQRWHTYRLTVIVRRKEDHFQLIFPRFPEIEATTPSQAFFLLDSRLAWLRALKAHLASNEHYSFAERFVNWPLLRDDLELSYTIGAFSLDDPELDPTSKAAVELRDQTAVDACDAVFRTFILTGLGRQQVADDLQHSYAVAAGSVTEIDFVQRLMSRTVDQAMAKYLQQ